MFGNTIPTLLMASGTKRGRAEGTDGDVSPSLRLRTAAGHIGTPASPRAPSLPRLLAGGPSLPQRARVHAEACRANMPCVGAGAHLMCDAIWPHSMNFASCCGGPGTVFVRGGTAAATAAALDALGALPAGRWFHAVDEDGLRSGIMGEWGRTLLLLPVGKTWLAAGRVPRVMTARALLPTLSGSRVAALARAVDEYEIATRNYHSVLLPSALLARASSCVEISAPAPPTPTPAPTPPTPTPSPPTLRATLARAGAPAIRLPRADETKHEPARESPRSASSASPTAALTAAVDSMCLEVTRSAANVTQLGVIGTAKMDAESVLQSSLSRTAPRVRGTLLITRHPGSIAGEARGNVAAWHTGAPALLRAAGVAEDGMTLPDGATISDVVRLCDALLDSVPAAHAATSASTRRPELQLRAYMPVAVPTGVYHEQADGTLVLDVEPELQCGMTGLDDAACSRAMLPPTVLYVALDGSVTLLPPAAGAPVSGCTPEILVCVLRLWLPAALHLTEQVSVCAARILCPEGGPRVSHSAALQLVAHVASRVRLAEDAFRYMYPEAEAAVGVRAAWRQLLLAAAEAAHEELPGVSEDPRCIGVVVEGASADAALQCATLLASDATNETLARAASVYLGAQTLRSQAVLEWTVLPPELLLHALRVVPARDGGAECDPRGLRVSADGTPAPPAALSIVLLAGLVVRDVPRELPNEACIVTLAECALGAPGAPFGAVQLLALSLAWARFNAATAPPGSAKADAWEAYANALRGAVSMTREGAPAALAGARAALHAIAGVQLGGTDEAPPSRDAARACAVAAAQLTLTSMLAREASQTASGCVLLEGRDLALGAPPADLRHTVDLHRAGVAAAATMAAATEGIETARAYAPLPQGAIAEAVAWCEGRRAVSHGVHAGLPVGAPCCPLDPTAWRALHSAGHAKTRLLPWHAASSSMICIETDGSDAPASIDVWRVNEDLWSRAMATPARVADLSPIKHVALGEGGGGLVATERVWFDVTTPWMPIEDRPAAVRVDVHPPHARSDGEVRASERELKRLADAAFVAYYRDMLLYVDLGDVLGGVVLAAAQEAAAVRAAAHAAAWGTGPARPMADHSVAARHAASEELRGGAIVAAARALEQAARIVQRYNAAHGVELRVCDVANEENGRQLQCSVERARAAASHAGSAAHITVALDAVSGVVNLAAVEVREHASREHFAAAVVAAIDSALRDVISVVASTCEYVGECITAQGVCIMSAGELGAALECAGRLGGGGEGSSQVSGPCSALDDPAPAAALGDALEKERAALRVFRLEYARMLQRAALGARVGERADQSRGQHDGREYVLQVSDAHLRFVTERRRRAAREACEALAAAARGLCVVHRVIAAHVSALHVRRTAHAPPRIVVRYPVRSARYAALAIGVWAAVYQEGGYIAEWEAVERRAGGDTRPPAEVKYACALRFARRLLQEVRAPQIVEWEVPGGHLEAVLGLRVEDVAQDIGDTLRGWFAAAVAGRAAAASAAAAAVHHAGVLREAAVMAALRGTAAALAVERDRVCGIISSSPLLPHVALRQLLRAAGDGHWRAPELAPDAPAGDEVAWCRGVLAGCWRVQLARLDLCATDVFASASAMHGVAFLHRAASVLLARSGGSVAWREVTRSNVRQPVLMELQVVPASEGVMHAQRAELEGSCRGREGLLEPDDAVTVVTAHVPVWRAYADTPDTLEAAWPRGADVALCVMQPAAARTAGELPSARALRHSCRLRAHTMETDAARVPQRTTCHLWPVALPYCATSGLARRAMTHWPRARDPLHEAYADTVASAGARDTERLRELAEYSTACVGGSDTGAAGCWSTPWAYFTRYNAINNATDIPCCGAEVEGAESAESVTTWHLLQYMASTYAMEPFATILAAGVPACWGVVDAEWMPRRLQQQQQQHTERAPCALVMHQAAPALLACNALDSVATWTRGANVTLRRADGLCASLATAVPYAAANMELLTRLIDATGMPATRGDNTVRALHDVLYRLPCAAAFTCIDATHVVMCVTRGMCGAMYSFDTAAAHAHTHKCAPIASAGRMKGDASGGLCESIPGSRIFATVAYEMAPYPEETDGHRNWTLRCVEKAVLDDVLRRQAAVREACAVACGNTQPLRVRPYEVLEAGAIELSAWTETSMQRVRVCDVYMT